MASETQPVESQPSGQDSQAEEPLGPLRGFLAGVGEPVLYAWQQAADIGRVFMLTVHYTFRARWRWREILAQMHNIGNRSVVFISVVLGFLGMTLVFQAGVQGQRIIGDLSNLGALFVQLLIREFAPTIGAMMLATRVGTGIAAEIGSMVVTEQVDALRMSGAQPVHYLIAPRFVACTVMSFVLSVVGVLVAFLAGMLTARSFFGVNYHTFMNLSLVTSSDLIIGSMKAVAYGMAIPVVAGQAGLAAFGGSEGVGWATTQAVVNASLAVVILDFLISGFGYVVFPPV